MADQAWLIDLLRKGRMAWNGYRAQRPGEAIKFTSVDFEEEVPELPAEPVLAQPPATLHLAGFDLQGVEFESCIVGGPVFTGCAAGGARFRDSVLLGPDLDGAVLSDCLFDNCQLWKRFERVNFARSRFTTAADLDECVFDDCDFSSAKMNFAFLRNVRFLECNLLQLRISYALMDRTVFAGSRIEGLCIAGGNIRGRARMRGAYADVIGIESIHGDPSWVRMAQDDFYQHRQDTRILRERPRRYVSMSSPLWLDRMYATVSGFIGGFGNWRTWMSLGLIAATAAWIVDPAGLGNLATAWRWPNGAPLVLPDTLLVGVAGALIGGLQAGWYGRRFWSLVWRLFDYGRDWDRVAIFAMALIALLGSLYGWASPAHLEIKGMAAGAAQHPFLPWFVATMGFCTLGLADYAQPKDGIGILLMIINVVAGFATLGLTLAVIQEKFSRGFSQ